VSEDTVQQTIEEAAVIQGAAAMHATFLTC